MLRRRAMAAAVSAATLIFAWVAPATTAAPGFCEMALEMRIPGNLFDRLVGPGSQPSIQPASVGPVVSPREDVMEAQSALSRMSFGPSAHGLCGKQTALAVWKFQVLKGLPPTGLLDDQTKDAIRTSAKSGETRLSLAAGFSGSEREQVFRKRIVEAALSMEGVTYVWGGEDLTGSDCSGSVYYSFKTAGARLARDTASGYHGLVKERGRLFADRAEAGLEPGDLVFWHKPTGEVVHVQVFLGEVFSARYLTTVADAVLNAPDPGDPLYIVSLSAYTEWVAHEPWGKAPCYGDLVEIVFGEWGANSK